MADRLTQKQRRALTRNQLLDAAAVVFAARGYHAASLDEIADATLRRLSIGQEDDMLALRADRGESLVRRVERREDLGAATRLHLRDGCLDYSQVSRWRGRYHPTGLVFKRDDADLVVFAE